MVVQHVEHDPEQPPADVPLGVLAVEAVQRDLREGKSVRKCGTRLGFGLTGLNDAVPSGTRHTSCWSATTFLVTGACSMFRKMYIHTSFTHQQHVLQVLAGTLDDAHSGSSCSGTGTSVSVSVGDGQCQLLGQRADDGAVESVERHRPDGREGAVQNLGGHTSASEATYTSSDVTTRWW